MKHVLQLIFLIAVVSCSSSVHSQNIAINTSGSAAASTNMLEVTQTSAAANMVAIYAINSGATAGTGYGLYSTKTGAGTTNVAGYFSATGGTNNYAGIFENGNVGIGTTSPVGTLHVSSSLFNVMDRTLTSGNCSHLLLRSCNGPLTAPTAITSGNALGMISFGGHDGTGWLLASVACSVSGSASENWSATAHGTNMSFATTPNTTTTSQTRMFIDQNGYIGMGTTTPSYPLHVYNSQNAGAYGVVHNPNVGATALAGVLAVSNAGSLGFQIGSTAYGGWAEFGTTGNGGLYNDIVNATGDYIWRTTASYTERMRLTNAGYVGIGTASPVSLLTVGNGTNTYPSTAAGTAAITLNSSSLARLVMNDGTGNFQQYLNSYYDATSATHKYVITGAAANRFTISAGTFALYVAPAGTAGNNITWTTAQYIDNSGNVGMGTTSPTALLHTSLGSSGFVPMLYANNTWPQYPRPIHNISASISTNNTTVATGPVIGVNLENSSATDNMYSPLITFSRKSSSTSYNPIYSFIGGIATGDGPDANWTKGDLVFGTANTSVYGPVEKMRLTSAGNLGINNTNPASKLDITSDATGGIKISGPATGGAGNNVTNGILSVRDNDNLAATAWPGGAHIVIWPSTTGLGILRFQKSAISSWNFVDRSTANSNAGRIFAIHDGNGVGDIMTFLGSGYVGVGTTSPGQPFTVQSSTANLGMLIQNNTAVTPQGYIQVLPGTTSFHAYNNLVNAGDNAIVFGASTGATGVALNIVPWQLTATGIRIYCPTTSSAYIGINTQAATYALEVGGTAYCPAAAWASDIRKKKNVKPLELSGLDIISKLKPVTYEWKEAKDSGMEGTQLGFIAQELEKVLPTMVLTMHDSIGSKAVKYNEMLPILVKGIQEQQKMIEELKNENAKLKASNESQKKNTEALNDKFQNLESIVRTLQLQISTSATVEGKK